MCRSLPAALLVALTILGLAGQDAVERPVAITPRPSRNAPSPLPSPNIRVDTSIVLVPVEVFTKQRYQPVLGLEQEHFRIYEDGIEQRISQFTGEDVPVSVGIIVDHSGSMSSSIHVARAGVAEFLKAANPEDQFFLVQFSNRPEVSVRFTDEPGEIQKAMLFTKPKGRTALLDAVYLALTQMRYARHGRRALLVLSDGADNSSRYTASELRNALRETNVQIYTVGIAAYDNGPGVLKGMSEESGGVYFPDVGIRSLVDVCNKIGLQLRYQYMLGYQPTNRQRDGKWRRVQVRLLPPRGLPKLLTEHRRGYFAPER